MENQTKTVFNKTIIANIKKIASCAIQPMKKYQKIQEQIDKLMDQQTELESNIENCSQLIQNMCGYPMSDVVTFGKADNGKVTVIFHEPIQPDEVPAKPENGVAPKPEAKRVPESLSEENNTEETQPVGCGGMPYTTEEAVTYSSTNE